MDGGTLGITPGTGLYVSEDHDLPVETLIMLVNNLGSKPNLIPKFIASQVPIMVIPNKKKTFFIFNELNIFWV